ncbi:hypothetical protein ACFOY8_12310 [Thalassospira xianhensis]|uniref:Uncharacterized protein n=1 Tax=Thalassospira xianhensis MCCC 1A02616 TaxID=1177929 RepID=A0A367UGB1_9PROT|nr:hypothetical protein [Thalassospira xianhensis]RCK06354.1 hypothetical protein TH5_09135 [Thalassospira xianhensis MCCC 1A02616]
MSSQFQSWAEKFEDFLVSFEDYLKEFPAFGWHEKYLNRYRDSCPLVQAGERGNEPGQPFFMLDTSIMLLLDGRQRLSENQRKVRKNLLFKWEGLRRSVSAEGREAPMGLSYWSGVKKPSD